jgi:hypothetical protein
MAEAMGLKALTSRSPAIASHPTKFHPKVSTRSKIIGGTHRQTNTERQAGDLISLLSFCK